MNMISQNELKVELENFAVNQLVPEVAVWQDGPDLAQWQYNYLWSYGLWIAGETTEIKRNNIVEYFLGLPAIEKSKKPTAQRTEIYEPLIHQGDPSSIKDRITDLRRF